jgi:GH18 family chitinase
LPEKNTSSNLLQRLLAAKESHRRLEIWIAIGGYAFSEPDAPTFKTFSELAASKQHQTTFCNSLNLLVDKYHLDGVDIDWYVRSNRNDEQSLICTIGSFLEVLTVVADLRIITTFRNYSKR